MKQLSTLVLSIGFLVGSYNSALAQSDQNTFVGYQAGISSLNAVANTFIGYRAGATNSGDYNLFIGSQAGVSNTSGLQNLFLGAGSGFTNTTGRFNIFIGINSGFSNIGGENNVFLGQRAGYSNTNGGYNMFLGAETGYLNTTGVYNTFIGNGSGHSNQTGASNTFIGLNSGFKTTSSENVSIGYNAGLENTSGTHNTFIGTGAGVSSSYPNLQNATAIGYNTLVTASNSVILGNSANVGIGNTAPHNRLEVTHGSTGYSGLRLTNLTSSFNPGTGVTANKFLTVNQDGDIYLAYQIGSGARQAASESYWQRNGAYLQSTNEESVIIGQGVSKTPSGYSLFVGQGILTEKVKVAVKTTDDWSDKVFDENYRLHSLPEVSRYIKVNKHLPGIPSAKEMVQHGNDLHQTDAKLLEKIEELTLYTIQLEKADQARQQQLNKQQTRLDALEKLVKLLLEKK